jgi:hypothetical protein
MQAIYPGITSQHPGKPDRLDGLIALLVGLCGLAAYVRTLAPDMLYADSAEFQTLAYTLGMTHSTGYPTYLLLGRLVGFLPVGTPAWRINFFSALCAGFTLSGVYLLARYFTSDRVGPALGSLALGVSYTFWSQAVIAEVYTPGTAFIVIVWLLTFHWQLDPPKRSRSLMAAAGLAGLGIGVHTSVWLIGPPLVACAIWSMLLRCASWSQWWRTLIAGALGTALGVTLFVLAFFALDRNNPPTSFINTTLYPSRIFWNLQPGDLDTTFKRMWLTLKGVQWRDAMFPGGTNFLQGETEKYIDRLTGEEFTPLVLLLAGGGLLVSLISRPALGAFLPVYFAFGLYFILNYQPGDKYVFYLSTYLPVTIAAGVGMGYVLAWARRGLRAIPNRRYMAIYLLPVAFFISAIVQPVAPARWQALRTGEAKFVEEDYAYPIEDLGAPRRLAQLTLSGLPENVALVLEWRNLFSTAYLAAVERGWKDMLFYEAMPHGGNGSIAETLIYALEEDLLAGREVYAAAVYPGLADHFHISLSANNGLYRLSYK